MPPWWVYKKPRGAERPSSSSFLVFLTLQKARLCGRCADVLESHFAAYFCLRRSFYQVLVIVQRDGAELNSFAVKLRFHQLPVYPAGVRGVDLSV